MHADAAMDPDHQHQQVLHPPVCRAPDQPDEVAIAVVDVVDLMRDPGEHDVIDQRQWDEETQHGLHRLPRRHTQGASAGQPPQRQRAMGQQRTIDQEAAHEASGEDLPRVLKRIHRIGAKHTQPDIDEMQQDIEHKHEPAGYANACCPCAAPEVAHVKVSTGS